MVVLCTTPVPNNSSSSLFLKRAMVQYTAYWCFKIARGELGGGPGARPDVLHPQRERGADTAFFGFPTSKENPSSFKENGAGGAGGVVAMGGRNLPGRDLHRGDGGLRLSGRRLLELNGVGHLFISDGGSIAL